VNGHYRRPPIFHEENMLDTQYFGVIRSVADRGFVVVDRDDDGGRA
jgi:hypothetical protein